MIGKGCDLVINDMTLVHGLPLCLIICKYVYHRTCVFVLYLHILVYLDKQTLAVYGAEYISADM